MNNNIEENNLNNDINSPITEQEILKAIKSLKNNKSPGADNTINEQIKASIYNMLPIYVKLFNLILVLYLKIGQ